MNVDQRFGHSMRAHRTLQGMSQRELSAALAGAGMNVDASAISRIESGGRSVRLHEAQHIADTLGCTLIALIGEDTLVSVSAVDAVLDEAIKSLTKLRVGGTND